MSIQEHVHVTAPARTAAPAPAPEAAGEVAGAAAGAPAGAHDLRRAQLRAAQRWAGNQWVQRHLARAAPLGAAVQRAPAADDAAAAPPVAAPVTAAAPAPPAAAPGGAEPAAAAGAAHPLLREIPRLAPGDVARLGELIRQAPLYGLILARDEKQRALETTWHPGPDAASGEAADALAAEIRVLDARISAGLPELGVADVGQLRQRLEREFPELWEAQAMEIAMSVLHDARNRAEVEQHRYGPSAVSGQVPDDTGALQRADQHLAELVHDIEGDPAFAELRDLGGPRRATDRGAGDAPDGGAGGRGGAGPDGSSASAEHQATAARQHELRAALLPKYTAFRAHAEAYGARFPALFSAQYKPGAFQNLDHAEVARAAEQWSAEAVAKIDRTHARLGGDLKLWDMPQISAMTYQALGVSPASPLALAMKRHAAAAKSDAEALRDGLVAVGMGLGVAALAATGAGAAVVLAGAAAFAGAGAGVLDLLHEYGRYMALDELQDVGLDPEVRAILEGGEPDLAALLLGIAALGFDLVGAAQAARALFGRVQRVRALRRLGGDEGEILHATEDLVSASKDAGLPPGAAERLAGASVDDAAVEAAEAAGARLAADVRMRMASRAARRTWGHQIHDAQLLLSRARGRIPDVARDWIAAGRVRPLTADAIRADFGHLPSNHSRANHLTAGMPGYTTRGEEMIAEGVLRNVGVHVGGGGRGGRIYVRAGAPDQMAGTIIHEATHALERNARFAEYVAVENMDPGDAAARVIAERDQSMTLLDGELKAHIAERDFYVLTFETPGGALHGQMHRASRKTRALLARKDNAELAAWVEAEYGLEPVQHGVDARVESVLLELFDDIQLHYTHYPEVPTLDVQ